MKMRHIENGKLPPPARDHDIKRQGTYGLCRYLRSERMPEGYDTLTECESCGETKDCCLGHDPYINEICPDEPNPEVYWCFDCHDQRSMDI